jgi:hypothetical protein
MVYIIILQDSQQLPKSLKRRGICLGEHLTVKESDELDRGSVPFLGDQDDGPPLCCLLAWFRTIC